MHVTISSESGASPKPRAIFVESAEEMAGILAHDVNVAFLQRSLPICQAEAYWRAAKQPWENRVGLDLDRLDTGVATLVGSVQDSQARDYLEAEIEQWAWHFAKLADRRHIQAQLSSISSDLCRKFHTDLVDLRLLCTYSGPATEWLRDEDVVRESLARFDIGLEEANRAILRPGATVQRAMAGDVVLLKGDTWPGNEWLGAVQRSPPIEADGERRRLLRLDTAGCSC